MQLGNGFRHQVREKARSETTMIAWGGGKKKKENCFSLPQKSV
jgi:hypothetical protein